MGCEFILTRGKNKGTSCNKALYNNTKFCKKHCVHAVAQEGHFDTLPQEVVDVIVRKLFDTHRSKLDNPKKKLFFVLEATNKSFQQAIINNRIYEKMCEKKEWKYVEYRYKYNRKEFIELYGITGCEICKKTTTRKVYEQYDCRICQKCLYENTVSELDLENIGVEDLSVFSRARRRRAEIYNPNEEGYEKSCSVMFYWKPDINKICQRVYGRDLTELPEMFRNINYENNMKLLEEYLQKNNIQDVSLFEIKAHTQFEEHAKLKPLTDGDFREYKRQIRRQKREEEIFDVLSSIPEFNEQWIYQKYIIQKSKEYMSLMRSKQPVSVSLVNDYLQELFYQKHFDGFISKFSKRYHSYIKEEIDFVKQKYQSRQYFTIEDKQNIKDVIQEQTSKIKQVKSQNTDKTYKCPYCAQNIERLFCRQGIVQHCWDAHEQKVLV